MKIRDKIRDAVRRWLLGAINARLHLVTFRIDSLVAIARESSEREAAMQMELARLDRCLDEVIQARLEVLVLRTDIGKEFALIQTERIAWKAEQKKQYADLLGTQQEMEQRLDRVLLLLEPKAARLRAGRPPVQDWDSVQQQNLTQFEEKSNG